MSRVEPTSRTPARVALAVALAALATSAALGAAPREESLPSCISVRAEARYRNYGYDHLVHVLNGCQRAAACEVWTDVAPTPQRVSVASRETATVVTFVGSPARTFSPSASCELR